LGGRGGGGVVGGCLVEILERVRLLQLLLVHPLRAAGPGPAAGPRASAAQHARTHGAAGARLRVGLGGGHVEAGPGGGLDAVLVHLQHERHGRRTKERGGARGDAPPAVGAEWTCWWCAGGGTWAPCDGTPWGGPAIVLTEAMPAPCWETCGCCGMCGMGCEGGGGAAATGGGAWPGSFGCTLGGGGWMSGCVGWAEARDREDCIGGMETGFEDRIGCSVEGSGAGRPLLRTAETDDGAGAGVGGRELCAAGRGMCGCTGDGKSVEE
jgi:hypothetical protein